MALKSRTEILNEGANADGASHEAILMAALNESQQEYKRLSGKLLLAFESYDKRIEALEAAVRASNTEKEQNYTEALKNASDTVLGDIQGKLGIIAILFAVIVAAFYVALLLYGWWYDIPEAIGKLDAVNNGIYQLLNR